MSASDQTAFESEERPQRVGVLIPPANIQCELEFPAHAPSGYSFHYTRLARPQSFLSAESLVKMKYSAREAAERLAAIQPRTIVYACTSGSCLSGPQAHAEIAQEITQATGIPAITTATAVLNALQALAGERIAVLTPYPISITQAALQFLKGNGMQVTHVDTYGYTESSKISAITASSVAQRVRAMDTDDCDAVFISCTNVQTLGILPCLEQQTGKAVVSSNSATLWAALRLAGHKEEFSALGRLGQCFL